MKRCVTLLLISMHNGLLYPQVEQSAGGQEKGDSLRLSDSFLRELERTFSLSPLPAEPLMPLDTLSVELLHDWVGKPKLELQEGRSKSRFDSTYFALKMYEKEFMIWDPSLDITIPGLTDGAWREGLPRGSAVARFDANVLGQYIRPQEIRIRKLRTLAEKARPTMDRLFPMDGLPILPMMPRDTTKVAPSVTSSAE